MIHIWSDQHFGHKNILEYSNRPFSSLQEMEDELIKRHNALVSTHDKVIYVGDVFFCDQMEASRILKRLNGYKILVLGNHDMKVNAMYKIGFDFVVQNMQIRVGKNIVNVCHYPYRWPWYKRWFRMLTNKKSWRKRHFKNIKDDGNWLIHGHTHSRDRVNGKQINVCVEAWDYQPVSITKISELIDRSNQGK